MRIHAFVQHYPVPYKPYYDSHFVDLIRKGHELSIFAAGSLDRVVNEKVLQHDLLRRTRYVASTVRSLPVSVPGMARGALSGTPRTFRRVWAVAGAESPAKLRLLAGARALALGGSDPDVCIVHGLGTASLFPWLRLRYPGVPIALYYHGGEVPSTPRLSEDLSARAFAMADVVFTNTEFSRRHAIERGCPIERAVILPVGFALEDYVPPPDRTYRPNGKLRLLSAGRMSEEKGFIYALDALRQVVQAGERRVSYVLTGEGYLRAELEGYIREHGLEPYVNFAGVLSTAGVIELMGQTDVLLLPSIQVGNWVENQACSVQEALLMGAVVITTELGGVPESIPPAMRRFAVPPQDSAALARALLDVAGLSAAELHALAKVGRRFVVEGYDVSRLNDQLLERTLNGVTGSWRRPAPRPLADLLPAE